MRKRVLEACIGLAIVGCLLTSCGSATAVAQSLSADQARFSEAEWEGNYYRIRARGSEGTRLEVSMEAGLEGRANGWLEQGGSRWEFTTECEFFANALEAFRHLPPLKPGPGNLQPNQPDSVPVPPRRVHGESWIIRTSAYAPDWSSNEIELRGGGGPYPFWVDATVESVKKCGPSSRVSS